ncbi:hypothetical protein BTO04_04420 [Polaribacter sp. SA4-10]|nr:hypothetical protein BTO04_04420 [Polaribacter sp. SA4-10]
MDESAAVSGNDYVARIREVVKDKNAEVIVLVDVTELDDYEERQMFLADIGIEEAGKMRVEGKEYIVKDGDVMHFRFNV